ncbi:hypothetical protein SUGI_1202950 [Cryptomeria japonica]|nr:hypothetical protein SUGI_1202950 [Cryptomeria japonica]
MPALHSRLDGLWIDGLDVPASMECRVTAFCLRFDGVWLDPPTGNRTNPSVVGGSIPNNPSRHCHMNNRFVCVSDCSWVWKTVQVQRAIGGNLVLRSPPWVHGEH